MSLLSTQDIAAMRTAAELALPGTAIISGGTFLSDAGGGGSSTWTPSGTVACRLSPISGSEREIADRIAEDATWIITLPAETSISTASRVTVAGVGFEVLALHAPRSWEITRRAELGEIV